jgi:hypothetical protein
LYCGRHFLWLARDMERRTLLSAFHPLQTLAARSRRIALRSREA